MPGDPAVLYLHLCDSQYARDKNVEIMIGVLHGDDG